MEDGIFNAHQQPAVRVTHSAAQSINSGVGTALAFNQEYFDQAGGSASNHHDVTTNNSRVTCLYAGVYQITASAAFASNSTGYRQIGIRLNGTTYVSNTILPAATSTETDLVTTGTIYVLAVNDYAEAIAVQTSGGALNVLKNAEYSPLLMMVRVGR